ncbi:MAG: Dabb family protein [Butyrivibrio sp.]|nr:Dabb family protein [Butyrivibrio sp.]
MIFTVKHIILWKLKENLQGEEKRTVLENLKRELEALAGRVPGLTEIRVVIDRLDSSDADAMLDSEFESEGALADYQKHPAHVKAADTYVRPFVAVRTCIDYTE